MESVEPTQIIKATSIMKLRPSSAPLKNINSRYNSLSIPNIQRQKTSLSIATSRSNKENKINKLTYRITKGSTIIEQYISTKDDIFANNPKYLNKSICNEIKNSNPDGSIKNAKGDIYCYKKDKKKGSI